MNRNNHVFNVLVAKGNVAILAKDQAVEALAVGQIGFFDAHTNVSVDATVSPLPRNIYIAVGVDPNGGTTLGDIRTSAGQYIPRNKLLSYTFQAHTAGRAMVVKVGNYFAKCETEYGITVGFSNTQINKIQGQNQFNKNYFVKTGCCDYCETGCGTFDANLLTQLMVAEINNDEDKILTAVAVARQAITTATHGTSVDYAAGAAISDADIAVIVAFNAAATDDADKVYTDFTVTPSSLTASPFYQVNLSYHKFLQTIITVSLVEGFNCSGVATTTTEAAFEEGSGINIQQLEYMASAWNGAGPYVLSETTGTPKGNINYLAVAGGAYDQFVLDYDIEYPSGWKNYESTLSTIIAVPGADTVTRASLATMLDAFTPDGFENLADDVATSNVNPAVVEAVEDAVATDGIA